LNFEGKDLRTSPHTAALTKILRPLAGLRIKPSFGCEARMRHVGIMALGTYNPAQEVKTDSKLRALNLEGGLIRFAYSIAQSSFNPKTSGSIK
jgi:hypothetical protein